MVETEISKLAVSNEGQVIQKKIDVQARKIPLQDIRKDALLRNKNLLKIKDDSYYNHLTKDELTTELQKIHEEISDDIDQMRNHLKTYQRQRHWLLWHDHSTLANYGHMLFCVRELYDPAIHVTRQEMLEKTGQDVDVQASVEEPQLYILGQSRSTVEDQMCFVPTRQEDLRALKNPTMTESGIEVWDKMRFMNGDNPAAEMEDGTQHGGNYGCPGCDGNINSSYDLEYTLQRKYKTLEDKTKLILAGPAGRKGSLHPFKDMKVNDLKSELQARGGSVEGKKEDLQKELFSMLGGTTRLPALLHNGANGDVSVQELNIENYEVLYFEALHCSMNHIKNLLQELPHHITDIDTLIKLKEILAIQYSKDKMRGVDFRKTLIFVTIALYPIATREVRLLLVTLCEMIEIYYAQDETRSPKMILRLHNLCWRHAILCRTVLTPPQSLTYRKLFGLYFHSCTAHSAQLLRVASHRSTNAEMFERLFEKLSDITTKTWSKRIEDLSKNAILHLQAEKSNSGAHYIVKEEREISKMAKSLPKLENTILLKCDLETYAGDWGAHLKLIADFLTPGEGVWWKETEDCIEFFDGPNEPSFRPEGPQLHHFRSTSISKEQELQDACWNECLENKVKVPATKLRDVSGKWERPPTCCTIESMGDSGADQDDCSDPQTELGQTQEDVLECDHELAKGDDMIITVDDGQISIEVDQITSDGQLQAESETVMEEYLIIGNEQLPAKNKAVDMEDENLPQPSQGKKRKRAEQEALPQEQVLKKQKSDALVTKTAKALEQVLGTCEDVLKYDKLKQNVAKNPKSRYHVEHYETCLARIQILTLKAYKKVFNDIQNWKDNFRLSNHREATEDDLRQSTEISSQRKKMRTASELLTLWKITVHLV